LLADRLPAIDARTVCSVRLEQSASDRDASLCNRRADDVNGRERPRVFIFCAWNYGAQVAQSLFHAPKNFRDAGKVDRLDASRRDCKDLQDTIASDSARNHR
jgi:hypothetical protein